jgi:hypothetical protein
MAQTPLQFTKATKKQAKARIAIDGPAGSGKTFSALIAAEALAQGGRIAGVDTEYGSMSLYADKFEFDVIQLTSFDPQNYINAIHAAEDGGYSVLLLDSISHAWEGKGGLLEQHDDATARDSSHNSYTAWRNVTPVHQDFVEAILASPLHIIATMRSKMDYVQEKDSEGRTKVRKLGMAPVQRSGTEYEFTMVADMDVDHNIVVSKSRCEIMDGKVAKKPDVRFWMPFVVWLNSGEAVNALTPEERQAQAQARLSEASAEMEKQAAANKARVEAQAAEAVKKAEAAAAAQAVLDAKKARFEGWNKLIAELVPAHYKTEADVRATIKVRQLTYSVEGHGFLKAELIALAQQVNAAIAEGAASVIEASQPAMGVATTVEEGAQELP